MVVYKKTAENPMPAIDEGWWASVLAEEGNQIRPLARPAKVEKAAERVEKPASASKPAADWSLIKDLYHRDEIVALTVTGHNRGGLLVEGEGLYGFVPFSHLIELAGHDPADRDRSLSAYTGRTLRLKVIECAPEDGRIVFSERAAQAEPGKRAEIFQNIHSGQRVEGVVTNVTDFGVFVDLGGVEGLIHISELSWGRVIHPSHIAQLGRKIEVLVLDVAAERCRVALSLKRLLPNPWEVASGFSVDQVVPATITSIVSYGAFARLDIGVEGLIHASEMPLDPGMSVKDILDEGEQVDVRILHVDAAHQRMGLSLRLKA
ncbi:MAG: S1 RNA-binding domain-containing protein [Chloroflexota bacterium]